MIAAFSRLFGGRIGSATGQDRDVRLVRVARSRARSADSRSRPASPILPYAARVPASSPMSIGTWGLTAFGIISALATGLQLLEDRSSRRGDRPGAARRAAGDVLALLGALSGFFVAGYTGVLLAATAVPLWSKRPALWDRCFSPRR